jgi:pyridoxine kinase
LNILSIQSWVATGHVGNAAALFPLQRLGAEVAAIHTVQFSNHPGHGGFTGRVFPPTDIASLVEGLDAHGTLATCDGVLSGYIGDDAVGDVILDAAARVRRGNPAALWCCDPVIGDEGVVYVRPGIADFFAGRAVPAADILTPNQFELDMLTGMNSTTLAGAVQAAGALRARMRPDGPRFMLVTSLRTAETPDGQIDILLVSDDGAFHARTALLPAYFNGAGDTMAALFLFHVLSGRHAPAAAAQAASSLAGILRHTLENGGGELRTIAAQQELLTPSHKVEINRV